MKITLRILITLLGLASLGLGLILFIKNGKMVDELAQIGEFGGLLGDALPSASALKTGGTVAVITSLFTLALIVVSFMKNAKNIMIVAAVTLLALLATYFLQPDYAKGLTGGATSREVAMMQLVSGGVAAGLAMLLSRKVNS